MFAGSSKMQNGVISYPAMNVIVLSCLIELAVMPFPVDHASAHGDGGRKDMLEQLIMVGMAHSINAALRKSEVNGLCEIQRRSGRITKI